MSASSMLDATATSRSFLPALESLALLQSLNKPCYQQDEPTWHRRTGS